MSPSRGFPEAGWYGFCILTFVLRRRYLSPLDIIRSLQIFGGTSRLSLEAEIAAPTTVIVFHVDRSDESSGIHFKQFVLEDRVHEDSRQGERGYPSRERRVDSHQSCGRSRPTMHIVYSPARGTKGTGYQ